MKMKPLEFRTEKGNDPDKVQRLVVKPIKADTEAVNAYLKARLGYTVNEADRLVPKT